MSHVEVPMILTNFPGFTLAPIAPTCASRAPTEIGIPGGKPVRIDHSSLK